MQPLVFNASNTFCITLETSSSSNIQRWERMCSRFSHFNMEVTKIKASTSSDLTDVFGSHLNEGQKGCAQSHINVYRHILEKDLEYALILEDDACFDLSWKEKLDAFSKNVDDPEWDAIFLNASEPISTLNTWVCDREQYLTAGYVISKRGIKKIFDMYGSCFQSSDWMTSRLQLHGHSYCYFPWLIIQEGRDSNIGSQLEADHAKVLHCLGNIGYSLDNYI